MFLERSAVLSSFTFFTYRRETKRRIACDSETLG